jgi:hypothetical protein
MQQKKLTLQEWNDEFDCGLITSYRKYNNCGFREDNFPCQTDELGEIIKEEPSILTEKEVKESKRAIALLIELSRKKYYLLSASVKSNEKNLAVIFVVDKDKKAKLKEDLIKLGVKYKQDSVLFLPQGALNQETKIKGYLIGTNKCYNNPLSFGKIQAIDNKKFTIFINGELFVLENIQNKTDFIEVFSSGAQAMGAGAMIREYEKTIPLELVEKQQKEIINQVNNYFSLKEKE